MNASALRDLIVARLVRRAGGTVREWRAVVGPIKLYSRATHAHCNWTVTASGEVDEVAEVERLLDELRLEIPYASKG